MADGVRTKPGGSTDPLVYTDEVDVAGTPFQVQRVKVGIGGDGAYDDVREGVPLPVGDSAALAALALLLSELGQKLETGGEVVLSAATLAALETITVANPTANPETGLAKDATLAAVLGAVDGMEGFTDGIEGLLADLKGYTDGVEGLLASIRDNADTVEAALSTLNAEDFATQTTLAAVLAKLISAPATEAKQDSEIVRLEAVRDRLPSALDNGALPVVDTYTAGEPMASQIGAGDVLDFDFASPVDLVWVRSVGGVSFADPWGGIPADGLGAYCADDEPHPLTKRTSQVKVWAPVGVTVYAWGYGG